jgi:transposase
MATSQSKFGRRFDEEFKREVAALASRPGAPLEQVASDLGVSPWSVSRWKRQYGDRPQSVSVPTPSIPGLNIQELERRIKVLERENADLREQRTILKKAVAIFSEPPR